MLFFAYHCTAPNNGRIYLSRKNLFVFSVFPNITAPVPGTVIRTPAGVTKLECTSTGTPPVYTAIIFNGSVRKNTTRSAELSLNEEGNYSCVATSYYGTNIRIIPVVIIGKTMFYYLLSLATKLPIIPKNAAF